MCTAATYKTKDFYFGRTLDYEFSYGDRLRSLQGIIRFISGMPVQNKRTMRSSAWLM